MEKLALYFPNEIVVLIIAALPVLELRGAIPIAQGVLGMEPLPALFWAFWGNLLPVVLLLSFLGPASRWLSQRFTICSRFFDWVFARTRSRSKAVEKYGVWGLIILVAIPLPITGGYTGSIAAFLLGIGIKKALPAIAVGVGLAGLVVTLAVTGTLATLRILI